MNVLLVITKGEVGGAQQSVFYLATELARRGVDVTVGCGTGDFLPNKLAAAHIPVFRFRTLRRSRNPLAGLSFIFELRRYLKTNPTDVIHLNSTNTLFGTIAARLVRPRPKVVFTFRGLSLLDEHYTHNSLLRYSYRLFFKIFLDLVDEPVFVSKDNQEFCKKLQLTKRDTVIYNGLPNDITIFNREEARGFVGSQLALDLGNRLVIGSVGRLAFQKNYEFLINNVPAIKKEFPDILYIIVGSGPEQIRYESLIRKLNLSEAVQLITDLPDAARILKAFDVFVLPSRYEGLSITLLEAVRAGLPILTTNVGGNAEIVGSAGLLYEFDDERKFSEYLLKLLSNSSFRVKLSQETLSRSQFFSISNTVDGYLKLYQS